MDRSDRRRSLLGTVLSVVLALLVVLGGFWYYYIAYAESPYDEVGIGLNGLMPEPIRKWGCDKLKARFGGSLPPMNCHRKNSQDWM